MSENNSDFARELSAHLTKMFNVRAWDDCDMRNNGRLLNLTGYEITAMTKGRAAVEAEAEETLQSLGHVFEDSAAPTAIAQARNDAREMATAVISFCRGPKRLN